jgi:hypothetical protein
VLARRRIDAERDGWRHGLHGCTPWPHATDARRAALEGQD